MSNNKGKHQGKLAPLCQLPPDIPAIKSYLKELDTQAQHVAANSNDYPKQTISADIWMSGYQLVNTARVRNSKGSTSSGRKPLNAGAPPPSPWSPTTAPKSAPSCTP